MSSEDVLFDGSAESGENQEKQKTESMVQDRYKISPLTLTVFKRDTESGVFRSFQLQRVYPKDDEGDDFGYTDSLRTRDLRKAARLFELAADEVQGLGVKPVNKGGGE